MTSTNWVNLQKYDQPDPVPLDRVRIARMVASARQQLADSGAEQVSNETRFDCGYNAIRSVADVALLLQGFRTSAGKGGHHQLSIQCLEHTLGPKRPPSGRWMRSVDNATGRITTATA